MIISGMSIVSDNLLYAGGMEHRLSFGEWLEDHYLRAGFTQGEFAAAVGVAQSTVSSWVNVGKRPVRRTLRKISDVLEVDYDEVYERAGYTQPRRKPPQKPELSEGEIDVDDPFVMLWASHSGDIDEHDREILESLVRSMAAKGALQRGDSDRRRDGSGNSDGW